MNYIVIYWSTFNIFITNTLPTTTTFTHHLLHCIACSCAYHASLHLQYLLYYRVLVDHVLLWLLVVLLHPPRSLFGSGWNGCEVIGLHEITRGNEIPRPGIIASQYKDASLRKFFSWVGSSTVVVRGIKIDADVMINGLLKCSGDVTLISTD